MDLIKLETGTKMSVNCRLCDGAGVIKTPDTRGGLAFICFSCNGRGSQERIIEDNDSVSIQRQTGVIVEGINKPIEFKGRVRVDGITHVVYASNLTADPEYLMKQGYDSDHVVPYDEFYEKGTLPLPLEEWTCPALLQSQYNETVNFDNKCDLGDYTMCPRFKNPKECWDKFYGKGTKKLTYNRKQNKQQVLKNMKMSSR